jgi:hypothetical protein
MLIDQEHTEGEKGKEFNFSSLEIIKEITNTY